MTGNAVRMEIQSDAVARSLKEAIDRLDTRETEMVLDFAAVRQVDPAALRALAELAAASEQKAVKVALRGVNVDIYKVLVLVKLTGRFSFWS